MQVNLRRSNESWDCQLVQVQPARPLSSQPFIRALAGSVSVLLFVCLLKWKYQCVKRAWGGQVFISLLIGRLSSLPIFGHFDIKSLKSKEIHSVVLNLVKNVAPSLK